MKSLMLMLLIRAVKSLVTGPLYEHISLMVKYQMSSTLSKPEKLAAVKKEIAELRGDLGVAARELGENLINLAIETAVAATKK